MSLFPPGYIGSDENSSAQEIYRMHYEVLRILYLNQIIIGILGNFSLIFLFSFKLSMGQKTKPIILMLIHLCFANIFFLLFRGISKIIEVWRLKYFVDYNASKIISYLQRVTKGISLCSFCLLSFFQAITLSPSRPMRPEFKARVPKHVLPCCILCWFCNLLMDIVVPLYGTGSRNMTHGKESSQIGFKALDLSLIKTLLFLIWKFVYDSVFVVLTAITSGYMAFVLYRHHQLIQTIQVSTLSHRSFPEVQAAKIILLLASTFLIFNLMSSMFMIYMTFTKVASPVLLNISAFLSLWFPSISPFILLNSNTWISTSYCIRSVMNKLSLSDSKIPPKNLENK